MKKSIILSIAAAAAFATAAFTANTVSAADETPTYTNNVKDGKTKATITLKPTTDDGTTGGKELGITLDKAPNIDFGTQVLKAEGATYSTSTFDNPLQVTNNGYAASWNVNLAVSKFTSATSTLQGAQLSLSAGDVAAAIAKNGDEGNQSSAPVASGLDAGSASANIFTASATDGTQGVGTWTDTFADGKASLKVPAGNVAGTYSADLTWTLQADPTSSAPASTTTTSTNE